MECCSCLGFVIKQLCCRYLIGPAGPPALQAALMCAWWDCWEAADHVESVDCLSASMAGCAVDCEAALSVNHVAAAPPVCTDGLAQESAAHWSADWASSACTWTRAVRVQQLPAFPIEQPAIRLVSPYQSCDVFILSPLSSISVDVFIPSLPRHVPPVTCRAYWP